MFPVGEVKPVSSSAWMSAGGGVPSSVVVEVEEVVEVVSAAEVDPVAVSVRVAAELSLEPQPASRRTAAAAIERRGAGRSIRGTLDHQSGIRPASIQSHSDVDVGAHDDRAVARAGRSTRPGWRPCCAMARNSFLRQRLIPGASVADDRDLRDEVGGVVDVDVALEAARRRPGAAPSGTSGVVLEAVVDGEVRDAVVAGSRGRRPSPARSGVARAATVRASRSTTMTTLSCTTWLCSTFARRASGRRVALRVQEDRRARGAVDGRVHRVDLARRSRAAAPRPRAVAR